MISESEENILHRLKLKFPKNNPTLTTDSKRLQKNSADQTAQSTLTTILLLGALGLCLFNLHYLLSLPLNLRKLLINAHDKTVLPAVVKNSQSPKIRQQLIDYLSQTDPSYLKQLELERSDLQKKIKQTKAVLQKNSHYPDGYALLSLLYYSLRDLRQAQKNIDQALSLDPNRLEFAKIKKKISN
jgi:tetratricopeptide (TPR) repeat protein